MIGPFFNATESLRLEKVPQHAFIRLRAQLIIMDSWSGSNQPDGPDRLALKLDDGRYLLQATFTPYLPHDKHLPASDFRQSFPDNYPCAAHLGQTGAEGVDVEWAPRGKEEWGANAVFPIDFTFPHSGDSIRFDFVSSLLDGDPRVENESWGIGKVEVWALDRSPVDLAEADIRRLVKDLAAPEPLTASKALCTLISAGDSIVDVVAGQFAAGAAQDPEIAAMIARLDHDDFSVRETAQRDLASRGAVILPDLTQALAAKPSEEARSRLQQLMAKLPRGESPPQAQRLRRLLEIIGTDRAVRLGASVCPSPVNLPMEQGRDAR